MVNYFSKKPPQTELAPNAQGFNQENWHQGQGNQGRNNGNHNCEGYYVRDGNYNRDKNFNQGNYGNRNNQSVPYVPPQNRKVASRDGGGSIERLEDMLQNMRRRFDASDEHAKDLRGDLANIGQKLDAHAISIKHLELQMSQLSSTMNPRQPGTLPSNTV